MPLPRDPGIPTNLTSSAVARRGKKNAPGRPPDAERPPGSNPGAAHLIAWEGDSHPEQYPSGVPALGFYLRQPATIRKRRVDQVVARLSFVAHAAAFQHYTPGARFDADDIAARLRSILGLLDSLGMHLEEAA